MRREDLEARNEAATTEVGREEYLLYKVHKSADEVMMKMKRIEPEDGGKRETLISPLGLP